MVVVMNVVIKINRFLVCIVCLITVVGVAAYSFVARRNAVNVLSYAQIENKTIIIDAGHGGEDGGAVAQDGTMEKNLNLDIAFRLKEICELAGYAVCMTRENDRALSGESFNKNADMQARIQLAREHPDALFISIHLNKFAIEKYNGAQVFYSSNNSQSIKLAQAIQTAIRHNLQPQNNRQIKSGDDNSILLRVIDSPAVIVEGGFLSNQEELARLKTETYRSQLAYCIFLGVIQYQQSIGSEAS
jgi:N-acetylmuramoyl-L-alanine amidase